MSKYKEQYQKETGKAVVMWNDYCLWLEKRLAEEENKTKELVWVTREELGEYERCKERLEEAEGELKKVLKEHSLLLGLLCEIRLAYQGVGDFESTGENMVALIPRIDLALGLKLPGTETPDPDEDPRARPS